MLAYLLKKKQFISLSLFPMAKPTTASALSFLVKSRLLQAKRFVEDTVNATVQRHLQDNSVTFPPHELAHSASNLWTQENPLETDLTAGKIQNLRAACRQLHGLKIPAGEIFSFWKHVGRTTANKGFVVGRELREGCIIPTIGGGLCQLSNALYDASLKAGFEIIERHAHSQVVEGSFSSIGRDATVFWNYVDFRFRPHCDTWIEAKLSKDQLIVRFRSDSLDQLTATTPTTERPVEEIGNCFSCGVNSCFRNQQQTPDTIRFGKTAALLDSYSPEFEAFLNERLDKEDHVFSPIDGNRFRAPSYRWNITSTTKRHHATTSTLLRSMKLRRVPKQGKALQTLLLAEDKKLANHYAKQLDYSVSHVIVSQTLLPHLWKSGALGGRTFDVLATRLPLELLQKRLDQAAANNPQSPTLADFRVDQSLIDTEKEAFAHCNRVITPHAEIGKVFNSKAKLLDWATPKVSTLPPKTTSAPKRIFFPASPLGRKGIYELCDTLKQLAPASHELLVLGHANEGEYNPLPTVNWRQASVSELADADLVILPAYIEHNPRLLLKAHALGIPVIATAATGLHPDQNITIIESPSELSSVMLQDTLKTAST